MSDANANANQLHAQEDKSKSNDDSILLVKFTNHEKCLEVIKRYDIFNQNVTTDSIIDVSNYLKLILEHAEKKDNEFLIQNQENFQLIKTLLKYTKYYSSCSYIYENNPDNDQENLKKFLDEFVIK